MSDTIVGLDIGTSFIKVVIGEFESETENIKIIGFSKVRSEGLRNGNIVNIDAVTSSIKQAVEEAEQSAGREVTSLYASIGGLQVFSKNSYGIIGIDPKGRNTPMEIGEEARQRAISSAKVYAIPYGNDLIHIIPQDYTIDGLGGIRDPIGMMGVRLQLNAHLVMLSKTAHANIQQCVLRAGYQLNGVILNTLSQAYAVVHDDELELGSILIDLGGGTTDVMVLNKGSPIYTSSFGYGGISVTQDIAECKGIPFEAAEEIKLKQGTAWLFGNEENEEVIIPGVGGRGPECTNREEIFNIIVARLEEIMRHVKHDVVANSGLKELNGSIILTGGGALMPGIIEFTQYIWQTSSVRVGCSPDFDFFDSSYRSADFATAVGLICANKSLGSKDKKRAKDKKFFGKNSNGDEKKKSFKDILKKFM